jgi:polar amino acid transport system substrate-binding protein
MTRAARILSHIVPLLLLGGCLIAPVWADGGDSTSETLKVTTLVAPPFGMEDKGKLSGFCIDLWKAIAQQLHVKYEMELEPNVRDLLETERTGGSDIAISDVTITAARGKVFDFSVPIYDGGLQVMTRAASNERREFFLNPLTGIFTRDVLKLIGLIVLLVVVPAHVIWLIERHYHDRGITRTRRYYPGIFHAGYWAAATLATQAEEMPKSVGGRLFALLWMWVSVVFVAFFTAQMTAHLTVQTLQGAINGPDDLPGHRVATTTGSTAAMYLQARGIRTETFSRDEDVFGALEKGAVDAVVFDSPVLLYYAANEGAGKVRVVGPVFRKESYAIVFRANSPWRRPVNQALLSLKENGTYQQFYDKWFGGADASDRSTGQQ